MAAWLGLLGVTGIGAGGVIVLAALLRECPGVRRWPTGWSLAAAHSLIVLAPLYIYVSWDSPYGDLYLPYLFVSGIHITYPANHEFGVPVFHWLLAYMKSFPASVLCVIVGPGLAGLAVGGAQWWLLGAAWDRLFWAVKTPNNTAAFD